VRKTSILLLVFVLVSCSSFEPDSRISSRSPASVAKVFFSCKKGLKNLFAGTTKKKVKASLLKLQAGETLDEIERARFLKLTHEIPFTSDRQAVEVALRSGSPLERAHIDIIRNFIGRDIMLSHNTNPKLFKRLFVGGDKALPQSYGIEFELILDEVPAILNSYRVKTLTEQEWYSLGIEQRFRLAKEAQKNADDVDNIFVRLSDANPNLPEGLFIEPHGTIEGNGLIFDNLGDLRNLITYMSEHYGKFSWQPHLVVDANASFRGMSGYTFYEFDRNQLSVLENGFERYLGNEKAIPSANIVHYSLGPIDQKMADRLTEADEYLENGIMDISISGVKAMYAPHFRVAGPYGPGKMGFELRQFHKRYEDMFDSLTKLARDIDQYGDLDHYSHFSKSTQVSSTTIQERMARYNFTKEEAEDMELFFLALSEEILKYNRKMGGGKSGADFEHRLLYPLKDWLNHPIRESLNKDELMAFDNITKQQQLRFIKEVQKLIRKYDVTEVTPETLKEVRVLIADWAHKSKYSDFFENFNKTVQGKKRDLQYSYLPNLKFFEETSEKVYKFKRPNSSNFTYKNYLENTVEIAYRDIGKTGHMEIRVGTRHYSVNGVLFGSTMTSSKRFSGFESGAVGRVYRIDRQKINEMTEQIEAFIKSASKNNFPPFDIWGTDELVKEVTGGFKMVNSKNKGLIRANIEEIGGLKYFVNGKVKIPVVEREGQYYIRTTNCTRSVTDIMARYLDFNIGSYASAGMLDNAFKKGTTAKPYDIEVHY
tara:strand:- start:91 stop:2391 length:2301 start_codon:yes stop_codon:yes gene_type:complete